MYVSGSIYYKESFKEKTVLKGVSFSIEGDKIALPEIMEQEKHPVQHYRWAARPIQER